MSLDVTPVRTPLRPDAFAGRVVLVSGGGGGIGSAVVEAFSSHGAAVTSFDLKHTRGAVRSTCVDVDLADGDAVNHVMADLVARHSRIDVLVNCAAIYQKESENVGPNLGNWERTMKINVASLLSLSRIAATSMAGGGCIVNIASVRSQTAPRQAVAYGVSKAMVVQATQVLAVEWGARGIRVNAVSPGDIETPMNPRQKHNPTQAELLNRCPLGRMGRPDEVAGAILFLCSPLASYISGAVLRVDGGFLAQ